MKKLTYPYQGLQEFPVKDKINLFQTGLQEMTAARGILTTGRRLLGVQDPETSVVLVGEKSEYIKLVFGASRDPLMYVYYMPRLHRVDLYDSEGLLAVFERKKDMYLRCTEAEKRLGYKDLFRLLTSYS